MRGRVVKIDDENGIYSSLLLFSRCLIKDIFDKSP